jgi:hypothetical protein
MADKGKSRGKHIALLESFGANAATRFHDPTPRLLIMLAKLQLSEVQTI